MSPGRKERALRRAGGRHNLKARLLKERDAKKKHIEEAEKAMKAGKKKNGNGTHKLVPLY